MLDLTIKHLFQLITPPDLINQDADHTERKLIENPVEHSGFFSSKRSTPTATPGR